MRRAISWFLAGLPFDARSRRAIDETLLDWDREATALRPAQGREARPLEATVAELRGVASILRVTSLSVLRESVDLRWFVSLGWRFAMLFGLAFLMAFPSTLTYADSDRALLLLTLSLLPSAIASLLPLALLLILAWRPPAGRGPAVGGVMLVVVGTLALIGWIIPSSLAPARTPLPRPLGPDPPPTPTRSGLDRVESAQVPRQFGVVVSCGFRLGGDSRFDASGPLTQR